MKTGNHARVRAIAVMLMLAGLASTGCKSSGFKMPKMFSWSREPSATTLAGTTAPTLPESPATKYSPSAIASVGAGSSGTSSGNKAPTNGLAGQTSPTTQAGSAGLAAAANGYQTGPYQVGNTGSRGVQTASTYGPSTSQPNALAAGLPNPYGGTYGGAASTSNLALPNTVKNSLASGPNSSLGTSGYGPQGTTATAGGGYNAPNVSYPSIPGVGAVATGQTTASVGGPASATTLPLPSFPPASTTAAASTASEFSASAYSSSAGTRTPTTGLYQPGTTSRPTSYNFGGGNTTPPATTLPPNTASGAGPGIVSPTAPTTLFR